MRAGRERGANGSVANADADCALMIVLPRIFSNQQFI
jgi:hypothetical protein